MNNIIIRLDNIDQNNYTDVNTNELLLCDQCTRYHHQILKELKKIKKVK